MNKNIQIAEDKLDKTMKKTAENNKVIKETIEEVSFHFFEYL